ncbi:MAG: helix-turn-helix transcriptional regulator [Nostoc sp. NMS7]|nr:helix-turn-helix transcriptional regulator [Nostoc sp. NMS7]
MARHKIKAIDLASELGMHPNSVTRMKNADTLPRMDGDSLDNLCKALDKLSGTQVTVTDLLERVYD